MSTQGRHLSQEEKMELYRALVAGNESATKLAARLGVNQATAYKARRDLMQAGFRALTERPESVQPQHPPAPEPPSALDAHDVSFWRREARRLEREHGKMQRVIEELGGVRNVPVSIPDWIVPMQRGRRGRAVIGMLVSDIHDGEVIDAEEVLGINAFNPEICEQRLVRYFEASCIIGERWAQDCQTEGALLALAGDLISGDIHEELTRTNALTAHEQVSHVTGVIVAGIRRVLETFPRVHVVGVPGNHGRTTKKPTAKLTSRLSYDTLVVSMVAERFANDDRVTFQFGRSVDQITPVFGRSVFTTHGDKIGTRGGQGFVGPTLPIARGSRLIMAQQGSVERRPDLIQFGHYHTTGNPYVECPILANGSVPGYSEFGNDLRRVNEPPQQWTYLLHDRWWLRERQPVILTDLKVPEKPRVRIPVEISHA